MYNNGKTEFLIKKKKREEEDKKKPSWITSPRDKLRKTLH